MPCGTNEYFTGNGDVLMRRVGSDCGTVSEGWFKVGDANELMISIAQDFASHFESQSGNRLRTARWLNQTEVDFTLSVQNFDLDVLTALLQGTKNAAVVGGSVIDEVIGNVYEDRWVFTQYQGISAVTVTSNSGATTLVSGTDYSLDARNGGIYIIDDTNVTANSIEVDYTHVGIEGSVDALTVPVEDFQIRFNGRNLTSPDKPVIVTMNRAQVNASETLSLIGQEITSLTFTGALLPDSNEEYFTVIKPNAVS